ncbi:hypothetical protein SH580_12645 [Coraliomargarita algicola]|uniref:Na+/solute symporter n=1 Tax=Coraliomargarita algicola TaxID=3092156 RepID=A0ABZ0RGD3_9BACT|nr:hypothetical protein [Coraliomargarita sp. J2-16]WPJ94284.1 hypothetical protein SH580_12645 [Coraliomargarita sp. J2-16]
MKIEYITLAIYLGLLLLLGGYFSKFNKNLSDFVRGGGQGTWWMVGTSMLMSGISAFTFTGNASAAYQGGPSLLVIYMANCAGYAMGGLFLGRWFRQTRAYTTADVVRSRFGTSVEQFSAFFWVILGPFAAAIQLYALALFASTALQLPLVPLIIIIGIIVTFYSTMGGKWAVMATDFVQALVLLSITMLVFYLSTKAIGGFGAFFDYFKDPRFAEDFSFFNEPGHFPEDRFTIKWALIVFFMQFYSQISLTTAGRFIAAKDGREASRASWWAFLLMALGSAIWFLPPMVARFLFEADIMASGLEKPAESAYSFIATKLLPNGMMGIMIAAMFAATMSSMDSGLNGQVGNIVRNIIPRIRGALGNHNELPPKTELRICHVATLVLGTLIISYSIFLSIQDKIALFDAYLIIGSIVGVPMGFPLFMALWFKKLPNWSYFPIYGSCMIPSIWSFIDQRQTGVSWTMQERTLWILAFGLLATLICRLFYAKSSAESRQKTVDFFKTMHHPIDYEKEIGSSEIDYSQYFVLSKAVFLVGAMVLLLLFIPNPWSQRLYVIYISLFFFSISGILYWGGNKVRNRIHPDES